MSKSTTPETKETAIVSANGQSAIARINAFLETQPTVDDDPTETMLRYILDSPDPSNWNALWRSSSLRDSKGAEVVIHAYRVQPSDFEGGLRHYLVLDVTDAKTGEKGVITCSSSMAIAQVLNAQARVGLPITVRIVEKDKPTKAGFRPIHLEYVGKTGAPIGDPAKVVSEQ